MHPIFVFFFFERSDPFLINSTECGGERKPDVILIFISSSVAHIWIELNERHIIYIFAKPIWDNYFHTNL